MVIAIELKRYIASHSPDVLIVIYTSFAFLRIRSIREWRVEFEVLLKYINSNHS